MTIDLKKYRRDCLLVIFPEVVWMFANAIWAGRQMRVTEVK